MAEIREAGPADWPVLRDIRLEALRDAPSAFGTTFEREARFTEADWRRRAAERTSFLAYLPDLGTLPAGLAGVFADGAESFSLVSMWVRPQARGRSVGADLIAAVVGWARARGAPALHLWVTETNGPARRLYERLGFRPTGERQPLPSDARLAEIAMTRPL